ncbi:uncharacterized protein LOC112393140 isoform X3 [Neophocaena asiaeorientalis asiaeorientalis]|uniref:Uncharacterized protein LOC112393140 isoform X3 n=1 Tax=Neophocaena asiaeorientalis asiaeorientalis TaxID=1706337 RepID=A0A341AM60_NEOAA|nr:uncharacterized protein LOC112393140 isoform X3 [Neophocaena asiaeorientalis asiaeorientalis]
MVLGNPWCKEDPTLRMERAPRGQMKLAKLHQKEEFSKDLAKIQKICRNRLFTSHPGAVTADCFRTAVSCAWTKCRASFFVFTILASALSAECLAEPAGQPQAWVYVYSFSMMALNNRSHVAGGVLCQDYSGSHLHVGWRVNLGNAVFNTVKTFFFRVEYLDFKTPVLGELQRRGDSV